MSAQNVADYEWWLPTRGSIYTASTEYIYLECL